MIRRAGGGADGTQFLIEPHHERLGIQYSFGLLIQERFVGATATLGNEEEVVFIGVFRIRINLNLGRQIVARVLLFPHSYWGHLRIAQVEIGEGVIHAARYRYFIFLGSQGALTLLAHNNRGAGVLTHR